MTGNLSLQASCDLRTSTCTLAGRVSGDAWRLSWMGIFTQSVEFPRVHLATFQVLVLDYILWTSFGPTRHHDSVA